MIRSVNLSTAGTGAALRRERLAQHLSLDDVSGRTRISRKFLEAIETEAFDRLPGIVFTRGFVRQYAVYLKMDPAPLLESLPRIDLETVQLPDPAYYARPRREMPWKGALATSCWIALSAVAVAGAYFYIEGPKQAPNVQKPVVAEVRSPAIPKTEPGPTPAPAPSAVAPIDNRAVQVVLTARQASWVQIVADGKPAFTGILNPNDFRAVAADELIKVTAGNAGGVEISLNGKSLDPLGPAGQVRTVRLTAEGSEIVSR
jgi:transcriptional regulator with XRE-family HTH domain